MWNEKFKLYKSRLYVQKFNYYVCMSHTAKQSGSKSAVEHVPAGSGVPKTSHASFLFLIFFFTCVAIIMVHMQ